MDCRLMCVSVPNTKSFQFMIQCIQSNFCYLTRFFLSLFLGLSPIFTIYISCDCMLFKLIIVYQSELSRNVITIKTIGNRVEKRESENEIEAPAQPKRDKEAKLKLLLSSYCCKYNSTVLNRQLCYKAASTEVRELSPSPATHKYNYTNTHTHAFNMNCFRYLYLIHIFVQMYCLCYNYK